MWYRVYPSRAYNLSQANSVFVEEEPLEKKWCVLAHFDGQGDVCLSVHRSQEEALDSLDSILERLAKAR